MRTPKLSLALALLALSPLAAEAGGAYSMSNDATGNQVMAYHRAEDGRLTALKSYPTGGLGTGAGLGNQGALALSQNSHWLYVVNAGSDDISVFAIDGSAGGLKMMQKIASGGDMPTSLTVSGDLLYVLNAGSDSVHGFRIGTNGKLSPLMGTGSMRPLSGTGVGAAQVQFSRDGQTLVVTEKASNSITSFDVNARGFLGMGKTTASATPTPFGFAFGRRNQMFVSQANGGAANPGGSTLSAYQVGMRASLTPIGSPVPTLQTAACWVVVTLDNRFAYTSNTPNDTISGFMLDENGMPRLLNADGVTAGFPAGSKPVDLVVSDDNQYLYSLNSGTGGIDVFHIDMDGMLMPMPGAGVPAGELPMTSNGLAVF